MEAGEALRKIPKEGFLKLTMERAALAPETRTALVRRGNELLNQGKHELAKKIFLTTGYADGLVRLGEVYEKQGRSLEAFRMFWLAKYRKKVDPAVERMVGVVRHWLADTGAQDPGAAPDKK
jgi:hypothetical protein